jgi:hypothetical protein
MWVARSKKRQHLTLSFAHELDAVNSERKVTGSGIPLDVLVQETGSATRHVQSEKTIKLPKLQRKHTHHHSGLMVLRKLHLPLCDTL